MGYKRECCIHLFIYGLCNDTVSSSDYITSGDRMINE